MSESQPIGPLMDELGVTFEPGPQERVTDVLVLMKTVDLSTGTVGVIVASNGLDWVAQGALIRAADQIDRADEPTRGDDE
jgi:hypothetical protein